MRVSIIYLPLFWYSVVIVLQKYVSRSLSYLKIFLAFCCVTMPLLVTLCYIFKVVIQRCIGESLLTSFLHFSSIAHDLPHRSRGRICELNAKVERAG